MNNLAIIIPYFKKRFFSETLRSLARQTDRQFKVYIGDDASPEDPTDIIKQYQGKLEIIYKRFDKNLGAVSLPKQWERCVDLAANEEWFMILGDDDYLSDNVVEEFYSKLPIVEENDINVIKINTEEVDAAGKTLRVKKDEPLIRASVEYLLDDEGRQSLSEHIFRKSQYKKYGFADFPLGWISDIMAILEYSEYGEVLFIEQAKCYVRISSISISGTLDSRRSEKWHASKLFLDRVCKNLSYFSNEQKKKLFDSIQWQEKERHIKINIPNKLYQYSSVYGFRGILLYLRSR